MANSDMLAFYSNFFPACEINSTFYRILLPKAAETMVVKSRKKVRFILKLHQSMTHQCNAVESTFRSFQECLEPFSNARS